MINKQQNLYINKNNFNCRFSELQDAIVSPADSSPPSSPPTDVPSDTEDSDSELDMEEGDCVIRCGLGGATFNENQS